MSNIKHGKQMLQSHFRGELANGTRFMYCPIGSIVSWSEGDYINGWCEWCKEYFIEETQ